MSADGRTDELSGARVVVAGGRPVPPAYRPRSGEAVRVEARQRPQRLSADRALLGGLLGEG